MKLEVHVAKQQDDESCGITCLKAICEDYSHPASLDKLKREIEHRRTGGAVAVNLARHALVPKHLSNQLRLRQRHARGLTIPDPMRRNPLPDTVTYGLPCAKFSNAVMPGKPTYDENPLVIPKPVARHERAITEK